MRRALIFLAAAILCAGVAGAQAMLGRAPAWAERLVLSDIAQTTGGRAVLAGDGIAFSVRVAIAPNQGGVARVIRVDARGEEATQLFLRRFTGHPGAGWWIWGPDTPTTTDLTAAQRAEIERLARSVLTVGSAGVTSTDSCANGERAFVEVAFGTRTTSQTRECVGQDPAGQLVTALSNLAGSRDEGELYAAANAELLAADRAFAEMAQTEGPAAAFTHFAGDEAHQFTPGRDPAVGRDAIAAYWAALPAGRTLTWEPQHAQVSDRGDMGWTWGRGVTIVNGARTTSRYVTVWRRNYEGEWRFVADAGMADPPQRQN